MGERLWWGGGIKHGEPPARLGVILVLFFFLFWSVVQITEKYNVDYCFKCGGFRGFNANKKTPEGVYAGCVGVRKNYRYVEWQWKVE